MLIGTAISVPGWFMECIELWLLLSVLTGGVPSFTAGSLSLLAQATFIHASASAVGALLIFLPGGIGGYETYAGIVMVSLGILLSIATTSIILIRFVTLWFSVIVGFIALGIVTHRTRMRRKKEAQQS